MSNRIFFPCADTAQLHDSYRCWQGTSGLGAGHFDVHACEGHSTMPWPITHVDCEIHPDFRNSYMKIVYLGNNEMQ